MSTLYLLPPCENGIIGGGGGGVGSGGLSAAAAAAAWSPNELSLSAEDEPRCRLSRLSSSSPPPPPTRTANPAPAATCSVLFSLGAVTHARARGCYLSPNSSILPPSLRAPTAIRIFWQKQVSFIRLTTDRPTNRDFEPTISQSRKKGGGAGPATRPGGSAGEGGTHSAEVQKFLIDWPSIGSGSSLRDQVTGLMERGRDSNKVSSPGGRPRFWDMSYCAQLGNRSCPR